MLKFYTNPTDIASLFTVAGSWQTADISAYVPVGTDAVLLKVAGDANKHTNFRAVGSTDNYSTNAIGNSLTNGGMCYLVKLDANRQFQYFLQTGSTLSNVSAVILAYSTDGSIEALTDANVPSLSQTEDNFATGGTATANHYYSSYYPSNAIDGNETSQWVTNLGAPAWWQVDLGAGNAKVAKLILLSSLYIKDLRILGSNNGSTWDELYSGERANIGNGVYQGINLNNSTAYRYYRVAIDSLWAGSYARLYEVVLLGDTSWETIDVSGTFDSSYSGVFCMVDNTGISGKTHSRFDARKIGDTYSAYESNPEPSNPGAYESVQYLYEHHHRFFIVGLNGSGQFEMIRQNSDINLYILGGIKSGNFVPLNRVLW